MQLRPVSWHFLTVTVKPIQDGYLHSWKESLRSVEPFIRPLSYLQHIWVERRLYPQPDLKCSRSAFCGSRLVHTPQGTARSTLKPETFVNVASGPDVLKFHDAEAQHTANTLDVKTVIFNNNIWKSVCEEVSTRRGESLKRKLSPQSQSERVNLWIFTDHGNLQKTSKSTFAVNNVLIQSVIITLDFKV